MREPSHGLFRVWHLDCRVVAQPWDEGFRELLQPARQGGFGLQRAEDVGDELGLLMGGARGLEGAGLFDGCPGSLGSDVPGGTALLAPLSRLTVFQYKDTLGMAGAAQGNHHIRRDSRAGDVAALALIESVVEPNVADDHGLAVAQQVQGSCAVGSKRWGPMGDDRSLV